MILSHTIAYLVAVDLGHHILSTGSKFVLEAIGLTLAGR